MLAVLMVLVMPCAGQLRVESVEKIAESGSVPLIYPTGEYVLVRDAGDQGLTRIDLSTKERLQVTNNNIEGDIALSDGGTMVTYSKSEYRDHLRYHTIQSVNLKTGAVRDLDEPARESYAFRFVGGKMSIAKRNTIRSVRLLNDVRRVEHEYIVAVEDDNLVLYDGNVRMVLNPNGENTYLWQQLSPDENRIVYVAVNDKCHTFVYDISSGKTTDLGYYIGAPAWFGNDRIVGQQDEDDGHQMTASRLVTIKADGTEFQILPTPEQKMPLNPSASKNGKIVFENEGKIYLMEVKSGE